MNISELLNPLGFGMNIEIVATYQPEWSLGALLGDGSFQRLNRSIQSRPSGLGNQNVHMLRHDHIAQNEEDIPPANVFEREFEQIANRCSPQIAMPAIATECNEMKIPCVLEPFKFAGHGEGILLPP